MIKNVADTTEKLIDLQRKMKELDAEDKMCGKIEVDYVGTGSVTVTEGGSIEIANQPDDSKLGAVQKEGPFGETWLT